MDIYGKNGWINTEIRAVKLNISRVLPIIMEENNHKIMTLLKSLNKFRTGGPAGILITEVPSPNGP